MSKTIFDITNERLELFSRIEEAEGELDESTSEALQINEEEFQSKTDDYVKYIQSCKYRIEALKQEEERLVKIRRSLERTRDNVKNNLLYAMQTFGYDKVMSGTFKVGFHHSESVQLDNEGIVPEIYHKVKVEFDKAGIKEALKKGDQVPGCSIVKKISLSIR